MARHRASRVSMRTCLVILSGVLFGFFVTSWWKRTILPCGTTVDKDLDDLDELFEKALESTRRPPVLVKKPNIISRSENLVLIGVMTAQIYLDSRALAVHRTWQNFIPGHVRYFSRFNSTSKYNLPVVGLEGVDDSYPPQKKSFMMLKYMHDHYIDQYEWFMRADDDVYIKPHRLAKFLRSLNSSKPQFIGQAGLGTKDEFGQLSLDLDENFCMGGPGVLISRATLKLLVPHISYCLKNLYSTHEDVEVGRCVRRAAGIPCTWAFEMQHLFYHNYRKNTSYLPLLKSKEVQRAITLHPVKNPADLYTLHASILDRKSLELRHKILLHQREIAKFSDLISPVQKTTTTAEHGKIAQRPSLMNFIPESTSEVLPWEFITKSTVYSEKLLNPKVGYDVMTRSSLDDIIVQVMRMINKNSRQKGRTIDFKEVLYGYRRFNPLYGVDYILDILLTYRKHKGRKMTIPVRKHAYLQQMFAEVEFLEDSILQVPDDSTRLLNQRPSALMQLFQKSFNYVSLKSAHRTKRSSPAVSSRAMVHMILPLAGRQKIFNRFLLNFEQVCLEEDDAVSLTVILFPSQDSDNRRSLELIISLSKKYPHRSIRVDQTKEPFSRALALQKGASKHDANSLLLFIDVDIYFDHAAINRVRLNTRQYSTLYFPIVFSHYNPQYGCAISNSCPQSPFVFHSDMGYWRLFGFGIAAMYKSDMEMVGGYDVTIKGWGKEDVQFYTNVLKSNLTVFRAVEPGMVHIYHPISCDSNLDPAQYDMCIGSMASTLANQERLAEMAYQSPEILEHPLAVGNDSQDAEK